VEVFKVVGKVRCAPMSRMMSTAFGQLAVWILATFVTWALCWRIVSPVNCREEPSCLRQMQIHPGHYHVISTTALTAMAGHEVVGLVAAYFGAQKAQTLIPHIRSRCLPSCLLAIMFGTLAIVEWLFSHTDRTLAHVMHNSDGLTPGARPTYTLQYLEFNINVPILFVLSGYCSLGRPLPEVSRPLVVTNIYIILSWAATATASGILKWLLITISFGMFAWASRDMVQWCKEFERTAPRDLPSRAVRPWISRGLILEFLAYGLVYLLSGLGLICAETERKSFFALTFGSKIAICAIFVFIRADEYHKTLTDVLRKVSVSNVGMISILRGSFDILLPCVVDSYGRCKFPPQMSGDMGKLEKILGCTVAGANFKDFLAESDRADFAAYLRNVIRQADFPQDTSDSVALWTENAMPPIAQVLNSKLQGREQKLTASLHLSVVPKSSTLGRAAERHLVAAIRLSDEIQDAELDQKGVVFQDFKANQRQTSEESTGTNVSDAQTHCETDSTNSGIVANLADLRKLGASLVLNASADEASNWGPSLVSDDALSHLGAMAEQEAAFLKGKVAMDARLVGTWEGSTSHELGGYHQRIEFKNDCLNAEVTVMGQTLPAHISMNCSVEPHRLDIEVIPRGSVMAPPPIPYIFKIVGDSLHLCGPADSSMKRAKAFEGPGLCIMERVERVSLPSLPEPEPEWSRTCSPASEVAAAEPPQAKSWAEPVVAASLTLAVTSTLIALRKSL